MDSPAQNKHNKLQDNIRLYVKKEKFVIYGTFLNLGFACLIISCKADNNAIF